MKNWSTIVQRLAASGVLTPKGEKYAQQVVSSPPSRNPSNQSGRNLLVDFASRKMGHAIPLESVTLEAAHAQMMEIAMRCIGYWCQPKPILIVCTCRDGKKRPLWLTFDFLALIDGGVEIHECKPEAECIRLSEDFPGRYKKGQDGRWVAPEIEAVVSDYGIAFRIVTERDVPPTLVRNQALLSEVAGKEYSTPAALPNILRVFEYKPAEQGLTLAELLKAAETRRFAKNDIYRAIAKRDVFVPLADMLLVDEKTTRVFVEGHHSELYRLIHFKNEPLKAATLVLRAGDRVTWNGTAHWICNASKDSVYLQPKSGTPIRLPRDLLLRMIEDDEIVIAEDILRSREQLAEEFKDLFRAMTAGNQALAVKKQQFLDFLEVDPTAKPEHFGLEPVTPRSIQRWKDAARKSMARFGTSIWGLIHQPRPGRPRDDLDDKVRALASSVAEELYFTTVRRSANYCWREFRTQCEATSLPIMSKGAFRRHLRKMKNLRETTEDRCGDRAGYKYSQTPVSDTNWITAGDYPFKVGQMDGKLKDIVVVDDETGEPLGRPSFTVIILPHYGIPIGMAMMLEPPSYRSATMAVRDAVDRFGELPRFLFVDNGREFNNTTFDKLLPMLGVTRVNRPPNKPRFSSEIESWFRTFDVEVIHNLSGNTQASRDAREMTDETKPDRHAVWTLSALYDHVEKYCFELSWDAPSAALGTTPRKAFERDRARAPQANQLVLPPKFTDIAFFPEVKDETRLVIPGRGVFVERYYYWADALAKPGIERTKVAVRYDPYDLYRVFVIANGELIECVAKNAPELRNVTERHRHLACLARRRLKNDHGASREETHGRRLGKLGEDARAQEKLLREQRRIRAQQHAANRSDRPANGATQPNASKVTMPKLNFSHLRKTA